MALVAVKQMPEPTLDLAGSVKADSGELQGFFQQGFLPSKHAKTASLVIFSREDNRRAGSRGPVTLSHHSPESSRETLFEVEPPFAAL